MKFIRRSCYFNKLCVYTEESVATVVETFLVNILLYRIQGEPTGIIFVEYLRCF